MKVEELVLNTGYPTTAETNSSNGQERETEGQGNVKQGHLVCLGTPAHPTPAGITDLTQKQKH